MKYEVVQSKTVDDAWEAVAINFEGDGEFCAAIFVGHKGKELAEQYAALMNSPALREIAEKNADPTLSPCIGLSPYIYAGEYRITFYRKLTHEQARAQRQGRILTLKQQIAQLEALDAAEVRPDAPDAVVDTVIYRFGKEGPLLENCKPRPPQHTVSAQFKEWQKPGQGPGSGKLGKLLRVGTASVPTLDAIIREMTQAMKNLGAKSDLLGIVCSFGETYTDEQVLAELKHWNSFGKVDDAPPDAAHP